MPHLSAVDATENCETMNVVLIDNPGPTQQCIALVGGQYQSYHVQRWMRMGENGLDHQMPLRMVGRAMRKNGFDEMMLPKTQHVDTHQELLRTYLENIKSIRQRLKPIAEMTAVDNTIVVLTCNKGQSELLMNFACSSRSRGFELHNVLVFPTDRETDALARGLGLTTFYEESIMGSIPSKEAEKYGDGIFARVMLAKVMCVQLINDLGYDLLFQDVDVVWYRNPLEFFHTKSGSIADFDIYFQDDGSRQERYAPYSANSGFYFARSNLRTKHLFRSMLYAGDLIYASRSHQNVLIALLAEYSSFSGLRVKILSKDMEEFPGGFHYHTRKESVKKLVQGKSNAYIFHMSWTQNKVNKLEYFRQMGDWYLHDECIGKEANEIVSGTKIKGNLIGSCCSAEPLITCFYRDKPSKIPCRQSPPKDKKGASFW